MGLFRFFRRRRKKRPLKYLHKELAAAEAGWEHLVDRLPHFVKDYKERTKLLTWARTSLYEEIIHYFIEIEIIITEEKSLSKQKEKLEILSDEISESWERILTLTGTLAARKKLTTAFRWKKKIFKFASEQLDVLEDIIDELTEIIEEEQEKRGYQD
ncbi:hypothetical protein HYT55_04270 [Candidatus Woesearchaeota archaeon]|nr:hypothetical protein [Candidatus Woesearchaeota archaeon]